MIETYVCKMFEDSAAKIWKKIQDNLVGWVTQTKSSFSVVLHVCGSLCRLVSLMVQENI